MKKSQMLFRRRSIKTEVFQKNLQRPQRFKFVQKTSMRMGKQILDGCIDVNPYKRGSRGNACTYCKYRAVCGFDESVEGYQFRHLMEMSAEKLWETISKEVAADGHDVD